MTMFRFHQVPDLNNSLAALDFASSHMFNRNCKWKFAQGTDCHIAVWINDDWYWLRQGDWIIHNNDGLYFRDLKYLLE